jgi:hypothetical protein
MNSQIECYGCGALVPNVDGATHKYIGASAGCWAIYGEVLAKEYSQYRSLVSTHRLTTDTYAVQHPGTPNRQAIQSVTVHLASLYLVLEKGLSGQAATQGFSKLLADAKTFVWLVPPNPNGTLTIVEVSQAHNLEDHEKLVEAWARDVWAAWTEHHETIKQLAEKHLK